MTKPTQQQRIDRLAEWAEWNVDDEQFKGRSMVQAGLACYPCGWNPFADLNHARLLLLECERRGLLQAVAKALLDITEDKPTETEDLFDSAMILGFMAEPDELTEAVEVVAGLGEKKQC